MHESLQRFHGSETSVVSEHEYMSEIHTVSCLHKGVMRPMYFMICECSLLSPVFQGHAAAAIARLLQRCAGRTPCPNSKVLRNLCSSLCVDPLLTPSVSCPTPTPAAPAGGNASQEGGRGPFSFHTFTNEMQGLTAS